ncbi:hydroxyacid dehydrogenase [Aquibium sp. ELW1220]|uniref:hydroxyacid dehydrogenase n=1 Tax=Aquibium sp. ELW1220 TaxID=2976766 RepID=UPI0025B032C3|nr:hydroxyacid dehydrogenase [Aquibium sp. ELW1220]MDN2582885.1 hydroxyacid dehydrogenase [Aquibium sp. ELW1220]
MPDVVITEFMDEAAVARLRARFDTLYDPALVDRGDDLRAAVADARALIVRNRTQVRGALLDAATSLTSVGRLGVGLDNIDVEACRARGISVYPATGANDLSVAEYVMAAAMTLLRGAFFASADVAAGAWPRQRLIGRELAGRTMGLVGLGSIAREVAWRAQAFGMQVVAYDPMLAADHPAWRKARNVPLDGLLALSDVVSLHVPLTDATRNMIGAGQLAAMKPDAILINAARGGVVDEAALAVALRNKRLGGAALDVFAEEPLSAVAGERFKGIDNLILTPHVAGVTVESNVRVSDLIADTVIAHLEKA